MKFVLGLALALAALAGMAASAAETTCIPKAEMQEIARSFNQFSNLANADYCYDGSENSHLLAGIMFMRKTQFDNPMNRSKDELFSGTFASSWWNYFIGRINNFEIDNGCPKGVIAYVYMFGGRNMYACSAALTDQFSALDLASVFMHEARHLDGYPHITCSKGARQGLQGACDTRISDTGSYAVTVETYAQLARYAQDVHPALKAYARSAAVIYADEAFENPVRIDRKERFLVMANNKQFLGLGADGKTEALGMAPELGRIVMRSQHMILVPDNTSSNARFVFARGEGEIVTQAGDQAAEYNALSPADRPNLVAMHIGAQWNARVYKDKVRFNCDPRSPQTKELALNEAPLALLYPDGYSRAARGAQLMTQSGRVMALGCNGTNPTLTSSSVAYDQKYKSMYKVGSLTLGLTLDGYLREISGSSSKPFSMGALDGQIHEIVPNQTIDFLSER